MTIRYAYDGSQIIAEYDGSGTLLRKFVYGPGIDEPICLIDAADANALYYYHFDGLGSVVALCDVNSVPVERYTYDVFGRPTIRDANGVTLDESAFGNPYLFTGRAYDAETALYYYRARYYDYFTGRFLQPDPIGYGDGLNLYAYVGNSPSGLVDPSGLCKEQSAFDRSLEGLSGFGVGLGETVVNSLNGLKYAALHPWTLNPLYQLYHIQDAIEQVYAAGQQFHADITSSNAERNGNAVGRLTGSILMAGAMAGITEGIGREVDSRVSVSRGPAQAPRMQTQWTQELKTRPMPGRDGGMSTHIIERMDGQVNSVTHQVTRDGKIVHQHQTHIGKYGTERQFPDEWVQYPRVQE